MRINKQNKNNKHINHNNKDKNNNANDVNDNINEMKLRIRISINMESKHK